MLRIPFWQDDPPAVFTIHQATVDKVEPYGVFVRLDGFRRKGLVHSMQLSDHLSFSRDDSDADKVGAMAEVMRSVCGMDGDGGVEGARLWVKVVDVEQQEGRPPKIACSVKCARHTRATPEAPLEALCGAPLTRSAEEVGAAQPSPCSLELCRPCAPLRLPLLPERPTLLLSRVSSSPAHLPTPTHSTLPTPTHTYPPYPYPGSSPSATARTSTRRTRGTAPEGTPAERTGSCCPWGGTRRTRWRPEWWTGARSLPIPCVPCVARV